jgi:hypothetical protein
MTQANAYRLSYPRVTILSDRCGKLDVSAGRATAHTAGCSMERFADNSQDALSSGTGMFTGLHSRWICHLQTFCYEDITKKKCTAIDCKILKS